MDKKKENSGTEIRSSQLLTTWGPGSIIPLPHNKSGVVCGIDNWDNDDSKYDVFDSRLAKKLHVSQLRMPPFYNDEDESPKKIPYFLFPTIYYCTHCGLVDKLDESCRESKVTCQKCGSPMVPERFVVASEDGHLDDIPVLQLLLGEDYRVWVEDPQFRHDNPVYRFNIADTTALSGIVYSCKTKGTHVNISQLVDEKDESYSISAVYHGKCPGTTPWFGQESYHGLCAMDMKTIDRENNNAVEVKVVQSGGSNIWLPVIASSIYIPDNTLSPQETKFIKDYQAKDSDIKWLLDAHGERRIASRYGLEVNRMKELMQLADGKKSDAAENIDDVHFKFQEYEKISTNFGNDNEGLYVERQDIKKFYQPFVSQYFSKVCLLKRVKETRALKGFKRLEYDKSVADDELKHRISQAEKVDWLPAIQVTGEGFFLEFDSEKIDQWIKENKYIRDRAKKLSDRVLATTSHPLDNDITPKYLMIHTFAHLLINELSKECGYGSSSLRERIFCSDNKDCRMSGLLIYTTSGSSEGSLGGLVREGRPGYLENVIQNALVNAEWCSADPVCIESEGQGQNGCNLAACHNCTLLPETSCEVFNKYLDRVMVVGKATSEKEEEKHSGYFDNFLEKSEND